MLVDFFIVGAPKSGTTALAQYLSEHPDVEFSTPKEPHYFASDMPNYQYVDNIDDYHGLFTTQNTLKGEGSVWYLYSEEAIKNIYEYNSNAKIIVMLRNPLEMVASLHSQALISRDEIITSFEEAWDCIKYRKNGLKIPRYNRQISILYYDEIAKYYKQLKRLYSFFDTSSVHLVFFEDFTSDTKKAYENILIFLDLATHSRSSFEKINPNSRYRLPIIKDITNNINPTFFRINTVLKYFGMSFRPFVHWLNNVNEIITPRGRISREYKTEIINAYYDDITQLELMLSRDLKLWKNDQ